MIDVRSPCLAANEMAALLDGLVDDASRHGMLAHVEKCPRCAAEFETLCSRWSLGHLVDTADGRAGDDTIGIRIRLAASPPHVTKAAVQPPASAAIPRPPPSIPRIVDLEAVGRGGMGIVYRGRDTTLDRLVAVKVLWAWAPLSDASRRRAEREALMLARLDHPNVVAIYAAGEAAGTPYLVMEWVPGPSLQKLIDAGPLPPREAARLTRDLARALEKVHALGIVHRDIKPDNILLDSSADPRHTIPKLADFGLARPEAAGEHLTQADDILGTPAYMAPEQTGLDPTLGQVGPAADIHSLGGVLFAMLTGHAPYEAGSPLESMQRATRGEVVSVAGFTRQPADLQTIVLKCLHPAPTRRYRSAGDVADDLERFLEHRPVVARPISPVERALKWARRRPVAATAAGLAVALVVMAIGGTAYHVVEQERANRAISRSRDQAEEAIDVAKRSMERLTGASIKRMLKRGDALDEGDREFLRQVRDELLEWPLGSDPVAGLWFRLTGLQQVASLSFEIDQYEDALACQQAKLQVLDELDRLIPGDGQALEERLRTMDLARHCLDRLGREEEAIASARQSIALLEAATSSLPQRDTDLIETQMQIGVFLDRAKRHDEAVPLLESALARLRRLRETSPDDVRLATQEVRSLYNAQLHAFEAGRHASRLGLLRQLVDVSEAALMHFAEGRRDFAKGFSLGLAHLITIACDEGRFDEAVTLARRRRRVCRDFIADLDAVESIHRDTVDADLQLASLYQQLGQMAEAREVLDEAVVLADTIMAAEPALFDSAFMLTRLLYQRAQLLAVTGDTENAKASVARAITTIEPWRNHTTPACNVEAVLTTARELAASLHKTPDIAD